MGRHCGNKTERSLAANRSQENQPSGMRVGACGNVSYGSRTEAHVEIHGYATVP